MKKGDKDIQKIQKPNFPPLKIKLADLISRDATQNRLHKKSPELRAMKDEAPSSVLLKEGNDEDLIDLASRKMSSYLDAVKQFAGVAVETVTFLNSQVTSEVENNLGRFNTQKSSLDDLTRQMVRNSLFTVYCIHSCLQ